MKKLVIAFDCDWTLIKDIKFTPNKRIVELLKTLSSFKNTKIIVWSWQGLLWVERVVESLGIEWYVDWIRSKNYKWKDKDWKHIFNPDIHIDLAIDDMHSCDLWVMNLIVKEK